MARFISNLLLIFYLILQEFSPKKLRDQFPILKRLDLDSENYIDETQVISEFDLNSLQNELLVIKNLISFEYFIEGLDNLKFKQHLLGKTEEEQKESIELLDIMIHQISIAAKENLKAVITL